MALKRELRLLKTILLVGLKRDVSGTESGKLLMSKGFLTKNGRTSAKGKRAIRLL